ncbi:MAG: 30S ribosomal protein S6 [Fimbriimonadales bacterium]
MTEGIRAYEAMYILPGNLDEAAVTATLEKHTKFITEAGGTVEKAQLWERRRLAYPIKQHSDGNYCLLQFTSGPKVPAELSRLFRISDEIIRGRVFKREA